MITAEDLKRAADWVGPNDPSVVCAELGIDPAGAAEAMSGMGFGLSEDARGRIAIALLVGIKAARDDR